MVVGKNAGCSRAFKLSGIIMLLRPAAGVKVDAAASDVVLLVLQGAPAMVSADDVCIAWHTLEKTQWEQKRYVVLN